MAHTSNTRYDSVPDEDSTAQAEMKLMDQVSEHGSDYDGEYVRPLRRRSRSNIVSRILAAANVVLFLVLLGTWLTIMRSSNQQCQTSFRAPYSPAREDGVVEMITHQFKASKIFQSEPSPEVDQAWNKTMQYDNSIAISKELAKKHGLPRSVEYPTDTSKMVYGVSVFHELHCLDMIRQSMYPDRYFPGVSQERMLDHKDHCLDLIRQSLMCHADVSIVYWWNTNYTTTGEDGVARDSDYYLNLDPVSRVKQSFVKWTGIDHVCHNFDRVVDWLDTRGIQDRPW